MMNLLDLPDCMLEQIFEYLSYDHISQNRLVRIAAAAAAHCFYCVHTSQYVLLFFPINCRFVCKSIKFASVYLMLVTTK